MPGLFTLHPSPHLPPLLPLHSLPHPFLTTLAPPAIVLGRLSTSAGPLALVSAPAILQEAGTKALPSLELPPLEVSGGFIDSAMTSTTQARTIQWDGGSNAEAASSSVPPHLLCLWNDSSAQSASLTAL